MIKLLVKAYQQEKPSHIVAMFSGGHDSLCSTHLAMGWAQERDLPAFVAHINTGVGIEQTRQFVRDTCVLFDWELKEYHPPDKTYRDFVLEYGFPGPAAHRYAYSWLKERAIRQLVREHKQHAKDRIMLATGIRRNESQRRMNLKSDGIDRRGAQLWVNPILEWDEQDKQRYIEIHNLPRNEVVDILHMSGECLCGAYAKDGEFEFIKTMFPDEPVIELIEELEQELQERGDWQKWGTSPIPEGQAHFMHLCQNCQKK